LEHNHDLKYLSRHIFMHKMSVELADRCYTRYMQQWRQHGDIKHGSMFDRRIEAPARIDFLQYLAATAGDGFPPERRMRDAVLAARAKMIDGAFSTRERGRQ
jgi:hypothetical protein